GLDKNASRKSCENHGRLASSDSNRLCLRLFRLPRFQEVSCNWKDFIGPVSNNGCINVHTLFNPESDSAMASAAATAVLVPDPGLVLEPKLVADPEPVAAAGNPLTLAPSATFVVQPKPACRLAASCAASAAGISKPDSAVLPKILSSSPFSSKSSPGSSGKFGQLLIVRVIDRQSSWSKFSGRFSPTSRNAKLPSSTDNNFRAAA